MTLPVGIIKDNATDLKKGVELLINDVCGEKIVIIEDIGHVVANALKDEFADKSWFKKFLEVIRKGASRIRHVSGLLKMYEKRHFENVD